MIVIPSGRYLYKGKFIYKTSEIRAKGVQCKLLAEVVKFLVRGIFTTPTFVYMGLYKKVEYLMGVSYIN